MIAEPPLDAPDEEWLVWADAMQQIGDPRGELLALGHPESYVREHAEALLGRKLGRHVRKGHIAVTKWRRCYPDELELRVDANADGPQLVVDALGAPCSPALRGLSVAGVAPQAGPIVDLRSTLGWLREAKLPPSLTSLSLVDDRARAVDHLVARDYQPEPNLVTFGPLAEVWRAFAQLEHLTMVVADPGQIQFQVIRLPNLRSYTLHTLCWIDGLGDMLAHSQWPKLRSFELRCCDGFLDNEPSDDRAYRTVYSREGVRGGIGGQPIEARWPLNLRPLVDALADLSIERVALTSFNDADSMLPVLEEILHSPSLVELDVSDSAFDARHAEQLARHPAFARLARLVVERVKLGSPKLLLGHGPQIIHSCRPNAPTYRFIVGME